jgi:TPP-dependent 2-oxoacid decarboxylase
VRKYIESADLVIMLGTFITDMSMGFYTAKLDRQRTVLATTERVNVRYHRYDSIQFRDFLESLATAKITPKKFMHPNPHALPAPLKKAERAERLDMVDVFRILSLHLDERCCVVADIGDAIFGAVGIRSARQAQFIAPAYYMSMGFAVPASIGVAMAAKRLRPYVIVGDGAFQMTGVEISTAVRLGLNPIIMVLNNDGYGTMRKIRKGRFNTITQWNYAKICELVRGGESVTVSTKGEFDTALSRAQISDSVQVIELKIPRNNISPQLARISLEVAKVRGWKKVAVAVNEQTGTRTRSPGSNK